jgi:signal transduction histidine kinase
VTLLIVALGAIVYWLYRYRVGRIMELANVRTRIATDLHDDIGADLTRIAILSEVARQRFGHLLGADDLLSSIAEIARESVSAMSDIVWAINPTRDTLEDLTRRMQQHAREVLEQRDIALDFSALDGPRALRLNANTRRNLYLIFKEALNNIVRHASASAVRIDLKVQDSEFLLTLRDNGAGFDTARNYEGNGLLNMKRRAADFGGRLEISSAPAQGTRIELRFSV